MKLMKLLLIGLLSVVAFVACAEDEETPTPAAVSIVFYSDNATPAVFYDNASIKLNAIDAAGKVIPSAKLTWTDNVTGDAFNRTTQTIKATPLTKGNINVSVKHGTGSAATYDNLSLVVVPSAVKPTLVTVTSAETAFTPTDTTSQLTTVATYGGIEYDVTSNTAYTFAAPATSTELSISDTGLATATGPFAASVITGTFNTKTGTVSMASTVPALVLESVTLAPTTGITLPKGATTTLVATANYEGGTSAVVTTTAEWASSVGATATVDKGVITGVDTTGTTTTNITAKVGNITSTAVVVTGAAAVLEEATIVIGALTGAADATVTPTLTGKNTAKEDIVPTADLFDWTIELAEGGAATAVAEIDAATGVVTIKGAGAVIITATQKTANAHVPTVVAKTGSLTVTVE